MTLLFAQVAHSMSLNDVCDALRLHASHLFLIRGATPPSRNNLAHANRERNSKMAETLFWKVLENLQAASPSFADGQRHRGRAWRFKRVIHTVDSTVIKLVLSCISWAKHRRRKAAAKLHLRMDAQTHLPRFGVIDTAGQHDSRRAAEVCAGIRAGEIVVFDRAYQQFKHLWELSERGVFWITRTLKRQDLRVVKRLIKKREGNVIRDDLAKLSGPLSKQHYPETLRRVIVRVQIDGQEVDLELLTNNIEWQASSVADLYRCRWEIEVFFRQLKQTLQVCDFLGNSLNAVQWQLWMALMVYVLLKYLAHLSRWRHSFIRIWTTARAVLWEWWDLKIILENCGTAGMPPRLIGQPEQTYFASF